MRRRLTLAREALGELTTDELAAVAGAGTDLTCYTGMTICYDCRTITTVVSRPPVATLDSPCGTR